MLHNKQWFPKMYFFVHTVTQEVKVEEVFYVINGSSPLCLTDRRYMLPYPAMPDVITSSVTSLRLGGPRQKGLLTLQSYNDIVLVEAKIQSMYIIVV